MARTEQQNELASSGPFKGRAVYGFPRWRKFEYEALRDLTRDPDQLAAERSISQLLIQVRAARRVAEQVEVQSELRQRVLAAQQKRAAAARLRAEAQRKGQSTDKWQRCVWLWERIERQYRMVGDALLWQALGFDRRLVMAYTPNQDPAR